MGIDRFIEAIEAGRKEQGMTWEDVTNKCGVTFPTVCNWKRHKFTPRLSTMILLLEAVGKKIEIVNI